MITKKKPARWVAAILSVMMVFAFMPLLGAREAYAIPIKDTITIDVSHGAWTTDDVDQSKAIQQFLWDVQEDGEIGVSATANEYRVKYSFDFDKDNNVDVTVTIISDSDAMTIERASNPSLRECILERSPEKLAPYEEMDPIGYNPNSLAYYYKGIHFVITDLIKIKDSVTIDLTKGVQTISGAEAAAIKVMLDEMKTEGIIDGYANPSVNKYWYDLNKDDRDEIFLETNDDGSISLEVLDECNIADFTLTAPEGWAEDWALEDAGTSGLEYVYKSITFKLLPYVEIRNKTIDLRNGVQTFDGLEAYTIGFFLNRMVGCKTIVLLKEDIDRENMVAQYWYDLDNDGTADIYAWEKRSMGINSFTTKLEKTDTCSVGKAITIEAPNDFVEHWASLLVGSEDADPIEYMFRKITFNMAKSIDKAAVQLSAKSFTYNGKVQKPTIKKIGGAALKKGTDYTVKWSNASSKNAGKYTVTIIGKGKYTGTTKATYTIKKAKNPMKVTGKTPIVKYNKVKKATQKLAVSKVLKFTKKAPGIVTYTKAKGNGKITIAKKTGKVTIKKGLKKGTYTVKVKVRAAGTKNYKALTRTVTFKIKVN